MIGWGTSEKLKNPGIDYNANHLWDALRYALRTMYVSRAEPKTYACECKHCDITLYTSTKRLNCEYCGSSDPNVFECREL